MKKFAILFLLVFSVFLFGCTEKTNDESKDSQEFNNNRQQNVSPIDESKFSESSFEDLTIGKKVLIFGSDDGTGIIFASRVIIGDNMDDFPESKPIIPTTTIDSSGVPAGFDPELLDDVNRPNNMPDFQNMSEEERGKFREDMMANGSRDNSNQIKSSPRMSSDSLIRGEVIDKTDDGFTVKVEEGGSKIIFVSTETKFMKIIEE